MSFIKKIFPLMKKDENELDLRRRLTSCTVGHFLGHIGCDIRGIGIGLYGETIILRIIFSREPTEAEVEELQIIDTELACDHEYMGDLQIIVVPLPEPIWSHVPNWGWVYVRRED